MGISSTRPRRACLFTRVRCPLPAAPGQVETLEKLPDPDPKVMHNLAVARSVPSWIVVVGLCASGARFTVALDTSVTPPRGDVQITPVTPSLSLTRLRAFS